MRDLPRSLWKRIADQSRYLHGKGFFFLLSGNFLGQFFSFTMILVAAKLIPTEQFGGLRVVQGYLQLLIPIAAFGTTTAVLKFCAEDRPEEQRGAILAHAVRRLSLWSLIMAGGFCALALSGGLTPSAQLAGWAIVMVWTVPLQNLSDACNYYLQALKRFTQSARFLTYVRAQNFVLVAVLTYIFGAPGFVYGLLIAAIAALVPIAFAIDLRTFLKKPLAPSGFERIAFQAMCANALSVAMIFADAWLLDHYIADRHIIGIYQWGALFSLAAIQINATAQNIAAPYFSERSHDDAWLRSRILSSQRKLTLGSVPVSLLVFALVWVLVCTIYPNYREALPFCAVLLLRYMLLASAALVQMGLLGKGRHGWNVLGSLVGLVSGVVAGRLLLIPFGAMGIAWGQVISALGLSAAVWTGLFVTFRKADAAAAG